MTVSIESTNLARSLVDEAVRDKVFDNPDVMTARIALALEKSWQQGLDDAETYRRVQSLRAKP